MGGVPKILTFHLHYLFGMSIKIRLTFCQGLCIKSKENPSDLCQGQVLISLFIFILPTLPSCWTENSPRKAHSLSDMRINPSESTVAHFPPTPKVSPLNPSVVMRKLTIFKSMTARAAAMKSPDNIKSLWSISDLPWCSRQWCWEDYHPPDDKQDTSSDLPSQVYWIGTTGLASMTLSILH